MASTPKSKPKYSWKFWLLLILIIVVIGGCIGLYVSRGWIKRAYYSYEARTSLGSQTEKLGSALSTLGLKNANTPPKCIEEPVYGYATPQLQCIAERQNYLVIGTTAVSKANFTTKARELDSLLKSNGWITTSNSATTLGEWFGDVTAGKDYSTDIDSVRNNGNTHCSLVFNVAYSNPKPPAFEIRMSCSSPVLEKIKNDAIF